jgi:dihydrofolate synthase/folylpolyglutamate synthase
MKYKETLDFLYRQLPMYQRVGPKAFKKDLKNIEALMAKLDHPHKAFKCIHIAGTNGKGSVGHIISSVLQEAGYKTGLYTSPHYKDFRERVKVNGSPVSKFFIKAFVKWYRKEASDINASFFELSVAMAFEYFKDTQVDVAVIETGLGGRLDSTNVIQPFLSIITNISYDHTNFLGETLPLIAAEKAGIIKKGVPVLIGRKQEDIRPVFEEKAKEKGSLLLYADDIVKMRLISSSLSHACYSVSFRDVKDLVFDSDIQGPFQSENIITALAALRTINHLGELKISYDHFQSGLARVRSNTSFIGRWMILSKNPLVLGDSAHNADGIQKVVNQLQSMKFDQLHFVLGMVNDKNLENVLAILPKSAAYYFAKADIPRGKDAEDLQKEAGNYGLKGKAYSSVKRALASAKRSAADGDIIYVGGSVFTLAEVI